MFLYQVTSCFFFLQTGVPPGSVLGPLLFTAYTSPVSALVSFGLSQQQYADDTQIYIALTKKLPLSVTLVNRSLSLITLPMVCPK